MDFLFFLKVTQTDREVETLLLLLYRELSRGEENEEEGPLTKRLLLVRIFGRSC